MDGRLCHFDGLSGINYVVKYESKAGDAGDGLGKLSIVDCTGTLVEKTHSLTPLLVLSQTLLYCVSRPDVTVLAMQPISLYA